MEDDVQVQPEKRVSWLTRVSTNLYKRVDTYLLYLLAAELGYFIFLMVAGVVFAVLVLLIDLDLKLYRYETSILWPVLVYILALPLNLLGGFAGLVLNICSKHQGYPGTGHLLNWIFLATTAWLFIIAIVFFLPLAAGTY